MTKKIKNREKYSMKSKKQMSISISIDSIGWVGECSTTTGMSHSGLIEFILKAVKENKMERLLILSSN
jgi:hypothetical protein